MRVRAAPLRAKADQACGHGKRRRNILSSSTLAVYIDPPSKTG
jgi:hypothetical protein